MDNLDKLAQRSTCPSLVLFNLANCAFGDCRGSCPFNHINPSSVHYKRVYLDGDGNLNSVMDVVVDSVLNLLKWIDDHVRMDDFHHVEIEKKFQAYVKKWHAAGHNQLDLAKFQLMIVVQTCCLIKVGVKRGHKDMHNLVYPIQLSVWEQWSS
jgi:hypothetical protein